MVSKTLTLKTHRHTHTKRWCFYLLSQGLSYIFCVCAVWGGFLSAVFGSKLLNKHYSAYIYGWAVEYLPRHR